MSSSAVALQIKFDSHIDNEMEFLESSIGIRATEFELKSRLLEIENEFFQAKERHDKIFLAKPHESTKTYLEENTFTSIRNKYHKLWGMLSDRIPRPAVQSELFNSTSLAPQNRTITEVKLAKIDLPVFSGKYHEWMAFDNLFTATVHNNPNIEPIIKLQRLKRALTGDAEAIIKNLQLNDANYDVARKLLKKRFQHTRRLVNSYLQQLYDLAPMKVESSKNLKTILNVLNQMIVRQP